MGRCARTGKLLKSVEDIGARLVRWGFVRGDITARRRLDPAGFLRDEWNGPVNREVPEAPSERWLCGGRNASDARAGRPVKR